MLLRGKSDKNMKNNSIHNSHNTVYHHEPLIITWDIRFPGLHTPRFEKLVEQDFHFLFTEEGKKSRVNFLIVHHFEYTDVLQEQNNAPANIKGHLTSQNKRDASK